MVTVGRVNPSYRLHDINPLPTQTLLQEQRNPCQGKQHGNLHKRPDSCCKRLVRTDTVHSDRDCYRQLLMGVNYQGCSIMINSTHEVVTPGSECLHYGHLVPKDLLLIRFPATQIVDPSESGCPHDHEVEDHWNKDSKDWSKIMDYVMALVGEHDQYGVQETQ